MCETVERADRVMAEIQVLVFSKDRPLQLDGTLCSFFAHCLDPQNVVVRVLYKASSAVSHSLYRQVMREHEHVAFVEENDFRKDVLFLLSLHEWVVFLVDDNIFIRDFSLSELADRTQSCPDALGFSLRLGANATYCYALNKIQHLPDFEAVSESILKYRWTGAECDFGYPLEVSSSLYRTADILPVVRDIAFSNPNTFEAELSRQTVRFQDSHPVLLCSSQSLAFCAPVNLVQQVCGNRVGGRTEYSAETLMRQFADGFRLDITDYDKFLPQACHQEVELVLQQTGPKVPLVSIVMPCYRQAEFLQEAVTSVIGQAFTDWELIIVDDGSPDDTAVVAEKIIKANPDRSIRLLRKANGGVSEARNAGIAVARGAYILPLDADDMIQPTMLEKTVGLLEAHPDIAIAYTDITHFGTVNRTIQAAEFDATKIPCGNQLNCCSLYRREAWELCGGYRSFYWYYEDWDFWVNCVANGMKARRIPEPLLLYRVKESSMYTLAVEHDRELRARIVLNYPELYSSVQVKEAQAILHESPIPDTAGTPMVSVIVPTYNRPELLCQALRSILAQTMQDFEIIVINDAGIDVRPWINSVDGTGCIRHLKHPHNRGLAAARNTGLRVARGKYIAYLDDDDIFYPDHLSVLVQAAESAGHAVVYSDAYQALYKTGADGHVDIHREIVFSGNFDPADLLIRNQIPVLCVLHRRVCIDRIGSFDETFAAHEDWDMWIRLFHHYPSTHIKQATCEYRVQINGQSLTGTHRPEFYRTMKIIHKRYRKMISSHTTIRKKQRKQLARLGWELAGVGHPVTLFDKLRYILHVYAKLT